MRSSSRRKVEPPKGARKLHPALHVVPRSVVAAAEQSVSNVRPSLLRYIELHPALALLTGAAILALVCVIYLTQITAVSNANYTLQALQQEHTKLLREQSDLQVQIGRAQSLPNIESIARDRLGMVPLDDQYTYLSVASGPISAMQPLPTLTPQAGGP